MRLSTPAEVAAAVGDAGDWLVVLDFDGLAAHAAFAALFPAQTELLQLSRPG